jgi:hypothetical protein
VEEQPRDRTESMIQACQQGRSHFKICEEGAKEAHKPSAAKI